MARPDRPPGRDARRRPGHHPGPPPDSTAAITPREATSTLRGRDIDDEIMDRLWALHWRHGYFTRAEIEAALGLDSPCGRWECPGQFGGDGRWAPCCQRRAAS